MQVMMAGYQGAGSVHTQALAALAAALPGAEMQADVTASGATAASLFAGTEAGHAPRICYVASGYLSARVPSLGALDLPFAAPDRARLFAALDGPAGAMIAAEVAARTGLVVLGFWDNGLRHLSNRARPLRTPTDCAGLVIRTLDNAVYQSALAAMGFSPVVTDVLRLKQAVASGEVDAQENPLTNLILFGLQAHHRFVSLTGHIQGVALLVANRAWHDTLPSPDRTRLAQAATTATTLQRSLAAAEDARALALLHTDGVNVLTPDAIDMTAFRAACAPVAAAAAAGIDPELLRTLAGG
ncbi:TRAP transporter substrate-binding protein DctP [Humitalea sp. 24SJ18S-53]|uniref:TRAP transporter substrate-binding protein DctP n=1 Tax=Humitalea sp. 24SJ18S-53 TaxID=3422307 RepID=UPI003D67BF72